MHRHSPTIEGFKAVFRRPSFVCGEISWRWSIGFAGAALLALTCFEYLDTLPVTTVDTWLLRSAQPAFVLRALHNVLRGSAWRVTRAGLLLSIGFAIAWVVVASFGRAVTINAILDYFAHPLPTSKN